MSLIFYWLTTAILLFALYGSWGLSRHDWKKKNVCPKLMGIPACYIVFAFFLAATIVHLIPSSFAHYWYSIFIGVPALIALIGTVTELRGKVICPRTKSGIPMCYISLALCLTLLLTKYFSLPL